MIGETISHYHVLKKLGGGGVDIFYRAEDTGPGRFVTLNFLFSRNMKKLERVQKKAPDATGINRNWLSVAPAAN